MKTQSILNTKRLNAGFYAFIMISLAFGFNAFTVSSVQAANTDSATPVSSTTSIDPVSVVPRGPAEITADDGGGTDHCTIGQCNGGSTNPVTPICGNGVREAGEQCDGADLGGSSCTSQGYSNGTISCSSACTLIVTQCFNQSTGGGSNSSGNGGDNGSFTITNEHVEIVDLNSATVTWNTNLSANSRVIFDTVAHSGNASAPLYGYIYSSTLDSATVTNHSVTLTGLTPGVTYYWKAISWNNGDALGAEKSFTTASVVHQTGTETPTTEVVTTPTENDTTAPSAVAPSGNTGAATGNTNSNTGSGNNASTKKTTPKVLGYTEASPVVESIVPTVQAAPEVAQAAPVQATDQTANGSAIYYIAGLLLLIILAIIIAFLKMRKHDEPETPKTE